MDVIKVDLCILNWFFIGFGYRGIMNSEFVWM